MDIDALHSALLSITVVSEKIRAAREMLSATGDAPARLGKFLCEAENDLRMAPSDAWRRIRIQSVSPLLAAGAGRDRPGRQA